MYRAAASFIAALTAILLAACPAMAEPPQPCGWVVRVDEPTLAVPSDRPAIVPAEHLNAWNCEPYPTPMAIEVYDPDGAPLPGSWLHDDTRGLIFWTPDAGWGEPGRYSMILDYVFDEAEGLEPPPGTPHQTMLVLEVGESLPRRGYGVELVDVFGTAEQEAHVRCCEGDVACWVDRCTTDLRLDLDWRVSAHDGSPLAPAEWFGLSIETAAGPDAPPTHRWGGAIDDRFLPLGVSALPVCVRARLELLPEAEPLFETAWRCVDDFEPIGGACLEEDPLPCARPEPEPEPEPEPPMDDEPGPPMDDEPRPVSDAGPGAGEAPARGRQGCAVSTPGGSGGVAWIAWSLLAGLMVRRGRPRATAPVSPAERRR